MSIYRGSGTSNNGSVASYLLATDAAHILGAWTFDSATITTLACSTLTVGGVSVTGVSTYSKVETTSSLAPTAIATGVLTHSLGTDNVKIEARVSGAVEDTFDLSWKDANGYTGYMRNSATYAVIAEPSAASTGTITWSLKNRSITQTQIFNIQFIVTAL